jgi:ubiquinone/menaquinone biosynthesis C-methylase UbiE
MLEQKIYKKRFDNVTKRVQLWKILVNNFFQKFILKKDYVLEIACGYGEFINNIQCKKKFALDINGEAKQYLNKNVFFINSSSINIPLKEKSIDKIFISNFFEHINKDEIVKTIKEIKRILKKRGRVMILQPNIRFCYLDYWMFFDHITPIDDRALIEIFSIYDFECKLNIERFLPFTTKSKLPQANFLVYLYLKLPILWKIFGKQSFLIFEK